MGQDVSREYFRDEVRDGFFVPSLMKKAWAVALRDYNALVAFADSLGISLTVAYGSILGVIRHGGFIPWDDDLDTEMMRKDYEKLYEKVKADQLPEGYHVSDYTQSGDGNLIRKWLDTYSLLLNSEDRAKAYGFPFGKNVDIFINDYLPKNAKERQYFEDVVEVIAQTKNTVDEIKEHQIRGIPIEEETEDLPAVDVGLFAYNLDLIERVLKIKIDRTEQTPLTDQLWKAMEDFCLSIPESKSDHIISLINYINIRERMFPKSFYEDYIEMPFEFGTVRVPVGYDQILRKYYRNDYMTPRMDWDTHMYPFYRILEGEMIEKYGHGLPKYTYDEAAVNEVLSSREKKRPINDEIKDIVSLLKEAHGYLAEATFGELVAELDEVLDVLGQCQTLAIHIGSRIEARCEEYGDTISILEAYCDFIFRLHGFVQGAESVVTEDELTEWTDKLDELSSMSFSEHREVVFLVERAKDWSSLHTMWRSECEEENTKVTVIPVPYVYKDTDGNTSFDELIVETEGFPSEVTLMAWDEYDMEAHHPSRIIFQNPYDEFSDVVSVHPQFYSTSLVQCTDELVFVQGFLLREITDRDMRSRYTLGGFVRNPGFVYADRVLVQSENVKKVFVELLGQMDGVSEKVLSSWEEKIEAVELPLAKWNERKRVLISVEGESPDTIYDKRGSVTEPAVYDEVVGVPREWIDVIRREDGSFKKVMIQYVSASVLYEYGTSMIDKMKRAQDMMKDSEDVTLIWVADKYTRQVLRKNTPTTWTAYQKWVQEYKDAGWGIYDESGDDDDVDDENVFVYLYVHYLFFQNFFHFSHSYFHIMNFHFLNLFFLFLNLFHYF